MIPQIDSIERLLSILESQETLIKAQKDHIHALQMKLRVLEQPSDASESFSAWTGNPLNIQGPADRREAFGLSVVK